LAGFIWKESPGWYGTAMKTFFCNILYKRKWKRLKEENFSFAGGIGLSNYDCFTKPLILRVITLWVHTLCTPNWTSSISKGCSPARYIFYPSNSTVSQQKRKLIFKHKHNPSKLQQNTTTYAVLTTSRRTARDASIPLKVLMAYWDPAVCRLLDTQHKNSPVTFLSFQLSMEVKSMLKMALAL